VGYGGESRLLPERVDAVREDGVIKLKGIGHVNLRVADQEMTLGENFHTLDIGQHPAPDEAQRPQRGQIGLGHIAFQVGSYAALRDAYTHLVRNGVAIMRATNHVNQRSFYFADPDGNTLEIYYEMPHALQLFADGRTDQDEALPVSSADEPLPAWLLEDWPGPEMEARIERLVTGNKEGARV
jgi:hypothetical protein